MNRTEIMAMDGQKLCDWLNERCVFPTTPEIRQFYAKGSPIRWNLPACAFAARDWAINNHGYRWFEMIMVNVTPDDYYNETPIDWLRAAAIVLAGQEARK
jgi:hypothetical protein